MAYIQSPSQVQGYTSAYTQAATSYPSITTSWTQISVGNSYVMAIKSNGALFGWGVNAAGQLGNNTTVNRSSPTQVLGGDWSRVSAGNNYVLALRTDNTLYAWGNNANGQIGDSTTVSKSSPVQIGTSSWTAISAGYSHSMAIRSDSTLWTWGDNSVGQLGDVLGTYQPKSSPVQVGTASYLQIAAGNNFSLAIASNYALYSWGDNTYGQLGNNNIISTTYSWTAVASSSGHTLAIRTDGKLFAWGVNAGGQLGLGDTLNRSSPVQVGTSSWTKVSAGLSTSSAIDAVGRLFTWGIGTAGQLGDGTVVTKSSPVQVAGSWSFISTAQWGSIAVKSDSTLYVWGQNSTGQLGFGDTLNRSSPVQLNTSSWSSISASAGGGYIIRDSDKSLWGWGLNTSGQLGISLTTNRSSPVQIGTSSWTSVFANDSLHVHAIDINNKLFGWGLNTSYQLGYNDAISRSSPVQISSADWRSIATNSTELSSLGIQSDYSLWIWGNRSAGTTSFNFLTDGSSGTLTYSWSQVSVGNSSVAAIRNDGRLFMWGVNTVGQLGNNTTISRSSPVQVGALAGGYGEFWKYVSTNNQRTLAIRVDNTLWAWGLNTGLSLGTGDSLNRSSPVQLATSISNWSAVSVGLSHAFGLTSTGALYGWGINSNGQLGLNDIFDRSSPVQIGTDSFNQISAGNNHTIALRSDNTLYAWGLNSAYQIGDGTSIDRSSPVQISVTGHSLISAGSSYNLAVRTDGSLWSWGQNTVGQLGYTIPTSATSMAAGVGSAYISTVGNILYVWGSNNAGQLGLLSPDTINRSSPVQVNSSKSWLSISKAKTSTTTAEFTLAIDSDYKLWAWGSNAQGQLGNNTTINRSSPVQIGTNSWTNVSAGTSHSLAIAGNGTLWAWGGNNLYQLALNATSYNRSSPVQVGTSSWTKISAGNAHSLGISINNTLYAWGSSTIGQGVNSVSTSWAMPTLGAGFALKYPGSYLYNLGGTNALGQLGLTDVIARSSPTQIGTNSWSSVISTRNNLFAIRSDGSLWGAGLNSAGQLAQGLGDTIARSSPVQIGTSSWTAVAAGGSNVLGVDSNGKLYAWGLNSSGSLLRGFSWTQSGGAGAANFLLRNDGELWAWGLNNQGQFMDGTTIGRSNPIQIPGTLANTGKIWSKISTGVVKHGIDQFGQLWSWGLNNSGGLGIGDTVPRSSPVQITAGGAGGRSFIFASGSTNNGFGFTTDNRLYGWGENIFGQVGDGTTTVRSDATLVTSDTSWLAVSAGLNHTIGIKTDGTLWGWGNNFGGQLGTGDSFARSSPVQIGSNNNWIYVSAGISCTAVINSSNSLYMWGLNTSGQLGLGDTTFRDNPTQVSGTWSAVSVAVQGTHTVGITTDNTVYVWGRNNLGQLGLGDTVNRSTPTVTATTGSAGVTIAATTTNVIHGRAASGLASYDRVISEILYISGQNANGEFGNAAGGVATQNRSSPVQMAGSTGSGGLFFTTNATNGIAPVLISYDRSWTTVSAGASHALAIATDNSLYAWGNNANGELGTGDTVNRSRSYPTQIKTGISKIQAGNNFTLMLDNSGNMFTTGAGTAGSTGIGFTTNRSSPTQIGSGTTWVEISASGDTGSHAMAIDSSTNLWAWGFNSTGQLGLGVTTPRSSPTQIGSGWSKISTMFGFSIGVKTDGTLWGTGDNSLGSLGDSTTVNKSSFTALASLNNTIDYIPTPIGTSSWSQVAAGDSHSMALTSDNKLFAWGLNSSGQLAQGDAVNRSSPVQVGTESYSVIAAGMSHSGGLRSADSSLWLWGNNATGQLGTNDTISRSSPVQVNVGGASTSWSLTALGASHTVGLTANTLYTWGGNAGGQLGDNTTVNKSTPTSLGNLFSYPTTISTPTQVTTYSWISVSAGLSTSVGVTTDYSLWAWGENSTGTLGNTTTVNRSSPVQITSVNSYSVVYGNYQTVFAIQTSPTSLLYGWGLNTGGQLGISLTTNRSSPTQVATGTMTAAAYIPIKLSDIKTSSFSQVASGSAVSVIDSTGLLYTWGQNSTGQMGNNDPLSQSSPTLIGAASLTYLSSPTQIGSSSWTVISAGYRHSLGIDASNKLYSWGAYSASIPMSFVGFTTVESGLSHYAAIKTDGTLWTWGFNNTGQLGDNTTVNKSSPIQIGTGTYIAAACGEFHTAAIGTDGKLWVWGKNDTGQIGLNDTINRSSPVQVATGSSFTLVSAGLSHTLAVGQDYVGIWALGGRNGEGQLGLLDILARSSPVQVATTGSSSYIQVLAAGWSSLALRKDNLLYVWGNGAEGELGDGTVVSKSSPIVVSTTTSYKYIAASQDPGLNLGYQVAVAGIRLDGTLWTWGSAGNGTLGTLSAANASSPVAVTSNFTYEKVKGGVNRFQALRSDGQLVSWGTNSNGEIGDGTVVNKSSPVAVSGSALLYGTPGPGTASNAVFIDSLGQLYVTGAVLPTLGSKLSVARSSPFQISTTSGNSSPVQIAGSWTGVSAGYDVSLATNSTNALYFWGYNGSYLAGTSTNRVYMTSPVVVGQGATTSSIGATNAGYIKNS